MRIARLTPSLSVSAQIAESDLEKASIRSPINGVVLSRDVEPGQIVASSLSAPVLFTLAEDLTEMELQVESRQASIQIEVLPPKTTAPVTNAVLPTGKRVFLAWERMSLTQQFEVQVSL